MNELKRRLTIQILVCVPGQHRQILDQVLEAFDAMPDYDLSIMKDKQTLSIVNILNKIKEVLEKEKPDVVLEILVRLLSQPWLASTCSCLCVMWWRVLVPIIFTFRIRMSSTDMA